ncbi:MAG: hypothetical protein ACAI44_08860 [Candidatus Sericytochromatia bacterium]
MKALTCILLLTACLALAACGSKNSVISPDFSFKKIEAGAESQVRPGDFSVKSQPFMPGQGPG